jgi:hypothetical protein
LEFIQYFQPDQEFNLLHFPGSPWTTELKLIQQSHRRQLRRMRKPAFVLNKVLTISTVSLCRLSLAADLPIPLMSFVMGIVDISRNSGSSQTFRSPDAKLHGFHYRFVNSSASDNQTFKTIVSLPKDEVMVNKCHFIVG